MAGGGGGATTGNPNASKASLTEGASYERKKQRAKDARVKLNEAIERLSVALNLAGTQSKERIKIHKGWAVSSSVLPPPPPAPSPPTTTSSPSSLPNPKASNSNSNHHHHNSNNGQSSSHSTAHNSNIANSVSIEELVSKTADSAKKWDRPSFVGTAACMVQHLNAECEALMRELAQLRKERMEWMHEHDSPNQFESSYEYGKGRSRHETSNSVSDSGSFDDADKSGTEEPGGHNRKRRKIEFIEIMDIYSVFQYENVSTLIGTFLDPRSIIRATSVSRTWQYRLACMRSDEVWSPLCLRRFGIVQVNEWQNQTVAEDQVTRLQWPHQDPDRTAAMNLYRRMDTENVKPKCYHDGTSHLGGGKIDNVISAWASVVDRSNGETRRSVVTGSGKDTKYASLPVVELRILIQNVGVADSSICLPAQIISIDASTKRSKGAEMFEITSDGRFHKKLMNLDGSPRELLTASTGDTGITTLTKLELFESIVICTFIHAVSCPTMKKFRAKAKYVKILVNVRGTTLPLIIPIKED